MNNKIPTSPRNVILNWGRSELPFSPKDFPFILNPPGWMKFMTNKRNFFSHVGHSKDTLEWTVDENEAIRWDKVVARHVLEGSGGAGIEVWTCGYGQQFPTACPLYTRYWPKTHEYRVHVGRTMGHNRDFQVLMTQRKVFIKSAGHAAPKTWDVRNHSNGFVFVKKDSEPCPKEVTDLAVKFMVQHFPSLHFCALDILYHAKKKQAVVVEGNTAPGLEGTSIDVYVEYFKNVFDNLPVRA